MSWVLASEATGALGAVVTSLGDTGPCHCCLCGFRLLFPPTRQCGLALAPAQPVEDRGRREEESQTGEALERALCRVVRVPASHGTRGSPRNATHHVARQAQTKVLSGPRALGSRGSNSSACHHGPQHLLQVSQGGSWRGRVCSKGIHREGS